MEIWKKHPDYRRIEVSDLGNVRSVWDHKTKNLKPIEHGTTVGTYLRVSATPVTTGKQKLVGVHNLVAEMFVTKPDVPEGVKLEPNHDDGNKHNNAATNLTWMTRQQNIQHAIDTGLRKLVNNDGTALYIDKSKEVKVTNVETGEITIYPSAKSAAEVIGVPARTVQYNAFSRKTQTPVRGFIIEKT